MHSEEGKSWKLLVAEICEVPWCGKVLVDELEAGSCEANRRNDRAVEELYS